MADPAAVPLTCLCFLVRNESGQVLLGAKKRGLGAGKIVGLGGHVEADETARAAAVREVREECACAVEPGDLDERASIQFRFPHRADWEMDVAVFVADRWAGEPVETDEITPVWCLLDDLPFDRMWHDARFWLPRILAGERLRATFTFASDNATVGTADVAEIGPHP